MSISPRVFPRVSPQKLPLLPVPCLSLMFYLLLHKHEFALGTGLIRARMDGQYEETIIYSNMARNTIASSYN